MLKDIQALVIAIVTIGSPIAAAFFYFDGSHKAWLLKIERKEAAAARAETEKLDKMEKVIEKMEKVQNVLLKHNGLMRETGNVILFGADDTPKMNQKQQFWLTERAKGIWFNTVLPMFDKPNKGKT